MLFNLAVLFGTLVAMEGVGTLAHKYIMHGWAGGCTARTMSHTWACSKPTTCTWWRWG